MVIIVLKRMKKGRSKTNDGHKITRNKKVSGGKLRLYQQASIHIGICKEVVKLNLMRVQVFMMNGEIFRLWSIKQK